MEAFERATKRERKLTQKKGRRGKYNRSTSSKIQ
jgi:hypothetical protein